MGPTRNGQHVGEMRQPRFHDGDQLFRLHFFFCLREIADSQGSEGIGAFVMPPCIVRAFYFCLGGMLIVTLFTRPVNFESAVSLKTLSATGVDSSMPTSAVSSAE